jgi:hypothetical protein
MTSTNYALVENTQKAEILSKIVAFLISFDWGFLLGDSYKKYDFIMQRFENEDIFLENPLEFIDMYLRNSQKNHFKMLLKRWKNEWLFQTQVHADWELLTIHKNEKR